MVKLSRFSDLFADTNLHPELTNPLPRGCFASDRVHAWNGLQSKVRALTRGFELLLLCNMKICEKLVSVDVLS
jgi:hypothetical protein